MKYSIPTISSTASNAPGASQDTVTPRAWLEQWPTTRRSLISNLFHSAVRKGATTPLMVFSIVQTDLHQHLRDAKRPFSTTDEVLHTVLQALQTAPHEACHYAQAVLDWEALPYHERQRQKQERRRHFQRQYIAGLHPTAKQLGFLRQLGYTGAAPANRADASTLIDEWVNARVKGQL
jgi:hypothetical protein